MCMCMCMCMCTCTCTCMCMCMPVCRRAARAGRARRRRVSLPLLARRVRRLARPAAPDDAAGLNVCMQCTSACKYACVKYTYIACIHVVHAPIRLCVYATAPSLALLHSLRFPPLSSLCHSSDPATLPSLTQCEGACPAGSQCPAATITPQPCDVGAYCLKGSAAGILCPAGSFSRATDLKSKDECSVCPQGAWCASTTPPPHLPYTTSRCPLRLPSCVLLQVLRRTGGPVRKGHLQQPHRCAGPGRLRAVRHAIGHALPRRQECGRVCVRRRFLRCGRGGAALCGATVCLVPCRYALPLAGNDATHAEPGQGRLARLRKLERRAPHAHADPRMHIHIGLGIRASGFAMHTYTHVCIHTCMRKHTHTCKEWACVQACACTYARTHMYMSHVTCT